VIFITVLIIGTAWLGLTTYVQRQQIDAARDKIAETETARATLEKKVAALKAAKEKLEVEAMKNSETADKAAQTAASAAMLAALATPADWASYTITDLKLSFRYPKEWGTAKAVVLKKPASDQWKYFAFAISFSKQPAHFEFDVFQPPGPDKNFTCDAEMKLGPDIKSCVVIPTLTGTDALVTRWVSHPTSSVTTYSDTAEYEVGDSKNTRFIFTSTSGQDAAILTLKRIIHSLSK
jgi:hypothetical protein